MSFQIKNGVLTKYTEENDVTEVTIPNGVTIIEKVAFFHCHNLKTVIIPESVTEISSEAFCNCYHLQNVVISEGLTEISDLAFNGCISLENIVIPEGVKKIGDYAFRNCYHLKNVVLPNSVREIGESAFGDCQEMVSVTIPESLTVIGTNAFEEETRMYYKGFPLENNAKNVIIPQKALIDGISPFSVDLHSDIKYPLLWQIFEKSPETPNSELLAYISGHFEEMFLYLIDHHLTDTALLVCSPPEHRKSMENLLTTENIDVFLQSAIKHKAHEIQLALMEKKEKIGGYKSIQETIYKKFSFED